MTYRSLSRYNNRVTNYELIGMLFLVISLPFFFINIFIHSSIIAVFLLSCFMCSVMMYSLSVYEIIKYMDFT